MRLPMCGRYTLSSPADEIAAEFGIDVPPEYTPHYNIAPQQDVLIVGPDGAGEIKAAYVRWGLVPAFAESPRAMKHTINARAETLLLRPVFREAFLHRRCLIVADGFYEWQREDNRRKPFRYRLRSGRPFAFAGIWERWQEKQDGEPLYSCAIITTEASSLVRPVHDRMPAILRPADHVAWLDPAADPVQLSALLHPTGARELEGYAVSTLVNSVAHDEPACMAPV
jgi:putative SOS response-associated peptidase YedK